MLPTFGVLLTPIVPFISSTKFLDMVNPNPVPSCERESLESACEKASNIEACLPLSIPIPESITDIHTWSSCCSATTLILSESENLIALLLSEDQRIIGVETISVGSNNGSIFHASSIIKPALLCGATNIILVHNHPLGDIEITEKDIGATHLVASACATMGLSLIDHIVINTDGKSISIINLLNKMAEDQT